MSDGGALETNIGFLLAELGLRDDTREKLREKALDLGVDEVAVLECLLDAHLGKLTARQYKKYEAALLETDSPPAEKSGVDALAEDKKLFDDMAFYGLLGIDDKRVLNRIKTAPFPEENSAAPPKSKHRVVMEEIREYDQTAPPLQKQSGEGQRNAASAKKKPFDDYAFYGLIGKNVKLNTDSLVIETEAGGAGETAAAFETETRERAAGTADTAQSKGKAKNKLFDDSAIMGLLGAPEKAVARAPKAKEETKIEKENETPTPVFQPEPKVTFKRVHKGVVSEVEEAKEKQAGQTASGAPKEMEAKPEPALVGEVMDLTDSETKMEMDAAPFDANMADEDNVVHEIGVSDMVVLETEVLDRPTGHIAEAPGRMDLGFAVDDREDDIYVYDGLLGSKVNLTKILLMKKKGMK